MAHLRPTVGQLNYLDWEYGIFFHFGIRSFYPGHFDWDGQEMPAEKFDPARLDCNQWLATAKKAGAKYAILTVKHHDGFALWPTAFSDYGVKNSAWKNGRGDVVKEFVASCRKFDMKVGLYYSPAQCDGGAVRFTEEKEYDDYFINQITELLTNYGKIDYLWFDGCGSENHEYDKERIVREIFCLQPEILTFCDPEWIPCVRWIGNEDGYASMENPLVVTKWDFSELKGREVSLSEAAFLPAECDCKLRSTWFFDKNEHTIKELDELFGMYESSVGRGSNFLLNVGPDDKGLICDADRRRLVELGEKIRANYSNPLAFSESLKVDNETYRIESSDIDVNFGTDNTTYELVNTVVIEEEISNGQRVKSFEVFITLPRYKNKEILAYCGKTIGHKHICRFPAVRTPRITVKITESDGECVIKKIQAYYVK